MAATIDGSRAPLSTLPEQPAGGRGAPPDPAVIQALLDHLRARHGGAEAYLLAGGATPEDLALLRQRLPCPGT